VGSFEDIVPSSVIFIQYFNGQSDTQILVPIVSPFDLKILEDQELKTRQLLVTKRKGITISVAELDLID